VDACTVITSASACCVKPAAPRRSVSQSANDTCGDDDDSGDDMHGKLGKYDEFGKTSFSPSHPLVGFHLVLHFCLGQGT